MADDTQQDTQSKATSVVDTVKLVISVAIIVVIVGFGLANSDEVPVDLLVTDTDLPLIVVILGSAVAGVLIAALLRRRRS